MLRMIAERLSRNRRVKRSLPNGIQIYVSPDSQLKYLKRSFDRDLYELSERFVTPSSTVWDVGANCGVMSFNAAKARQIVAIEADPFLVGLLQDSVALSKVDVAVVAAAAFSTSSLAEFSIARRGRASNYLSQVRGHSQSGGERARIFVPTITLDSLLSKFDPPTFIKIDVEGAEIQVFEGSKAVLQISRPTIYYEASSETAGPCAEILQQFGYKIEKAGELNWLAEQAT